MTQSRFPHAIFFVFGLLVTLIGVSATRAQEQDVQLKANILKFIDASRTSNLAELRSVTTQAFKQADLPRYAILAKLGSVSDVNLGEIESLLSNLTVVSVDAEHEHGSSSWTFSIDVSKRILAAQLEHAEVLGPAKVISGSARHHHSWGGSRRPVVLDCDQAPAACNKDPRLVEFFYATDRSVTITNNIASLDPSAPRSGKLTYGVAAVHIPEDHEPGRIELPSEWHFISFEFKSPLDEKKHFSIRRLAATSLDDWKQLLKLQVEATNKTALIFVHGFNTGFEEALYRNAQIMWDLQYQGVSVLFSWSSKGKVQDYLYDQDSADIAQPEFIDLLGQLHDSGIERVDIIAHSMGNRVVLPALDQIASVSSPIKIRQLIMAAPDVARDKFMIQLPLAQKVVEGSTLYASSTDKALIASTHLADFPRAGMIPAAGPVILPNLDTIDVTAVGDEIFGLNHSVFATNRAVMDDLKLLIINEMKLPRLSQVRRFPDPPQQPTYWKYK
jgi:esterase/lipase superfamily enzyme